MVLKTSYCLARSLPLFLYLFFCIESFQLISIHINEHDSLRKPRMYPLDLTVHLLACDSVVRVTLWRRAQLYHMACFSQIHFDKIGIAIRKVDDVLCFFWHGLGYFFVDLL